MFPQIFGKYVLEREIAAGGMARVYLGTLRGAVGFEKRLVVKQIRPELASDDAFVRRFVEEAKTAVELGHPNIVPVYELGVEQGIYYIAMELCEGVTLAEILRETGPLSPEEGAYVGVEICRALDYAHRRANIVHRDVTPRNVMLDDEGAVRLIDFGIAAPVTLPDEQGTGQLELFGSPGHMPPEQIAGDSLTPATDVFAVAALLAEAWTGRAPFRRKTAAECVEALRQPPPRIDADDPALEPLAELVAQAMALDQKARPQTAEAFSRPLREFSRSTDAGDVARRLAERVRRTRRKLMASSPLIEPEAPPAEPGATAPVANERPRAPSIGDTQTFAVRNDLVEWTRKLPSAPPPPPEAVVEPVPPSEVHSTRPIARSDAAPESRDEPAPATSNAERTSHASRPNRGAVTAAVVVVVVLAIWGGSRFAASPERSNAPVSTPPPSTSVATATSEPSVPAPASASESVAPPHDSAPAKSGSAPTRVPAPPSGEPSAGVPENRGKIRLNLTSTPPSQVSVSGRPYGSTPVMGLKLPAGSYSVIFDSSTLGLRVGTSISVAPGATKSVHADFGTGEGRVFVH